MKNFEPLKNYEGIYNINKLGVVTNKDGKTIKPFVNEDGYLCLSLHKNGRKRNLYLHRLLCIQYITNPNKKLYKEINHKDRNRQNNKLNNLEWCDRRMNNINRKFQ